MNKEEARDKFGGMTTNEHGEHVWQAERSKLRGLLLRYVRACEEIRAPVEDHDADYYIDDFWEWLQDKMGDGFGGVFRNDEMSPSGKFDRVTKDGMERLANHMYGAHDGFTDDIDERWQKFEPDDEEGRKSVELYENLKGSNGIEALSQFFEIEWKKHDEEKVEKHGISESYPSMGDPKPEGYKEAMKKYTVMAKTIRSDEDEPNAEDFVRDWVDWLNRYVQDGTYHIVDDRNHFGYEWLGPPEFDEVVVWAKELWKNDPEFRDNVRSIWNNMEEVEEDDSDDSLSRSQESRHGDLRSRSKRGQQSLTDY